MTQIEKKGMKLYEAELTKTKENRWIMHMVTALLSCIVLLMTVMELTGFEKLYTPWTAILTGSIICVICGLLEKKHWNGGFYPVALFLILVLVLFGRQQILQGICLVWNQMSEIRTANTGWVLPEWDVQSGGFDNNICMLLFSILLGAVSGLLSCFLNSCMSLLMAVLLPIVLFVGMAFLRLEISFWKVLFVILCAACLLLYSGWEKKNTSFSAAFGWIVLTVFFGIAIPIVSLPAVRDWAAATSEQLHETVHVHKYETDYTTLPEGDFSNEKESEEEKAPALVVTMKNPEIMYLRGFAGGVFEEDSWTSLDTQVLAGEKELLYWLNVNEFNPNAQFEKAVSQMEGMEEQEVTVQNVGACSYYLYVPFSLGAGNYLNEGNLNTDYITAENERVYHFTAVTDGAKKISAALEYLQSTEDEETTDYRRAESAYREFIYENYLQIPQEVEALLAEEWNKVASEYGNVGELTTEQAQECVLTFLEKCFPDDKKAKKITLPLSVAEGTSFQYATVAAMTLRYFGIPSRYAEGYIISEKMASKAKAGETIEVNSSCAAGWVEVYQDGIGWVPMELTPGMEELKPKESEDASQEDDTDLKEAEELEEMPETEPESEGGFLVKLPKLGLAEFYKILLLLLVVVIAFVIRRKILLSRKEKRFQAADVNDAVAWIFADTALILSNMGFGRGKGSMQELQEPIREKFGEDYAVEYKKMVSFNGAALFSSHSLGEEVRQTALKFRENTLVHLKTNTKWYKRMRLVWIHCLY